MQFSIYFSDGSLDRHEYEGEYNASNFEAVSAQADREGQYNRVSAFYYRRRNDETGLIVIGGTAQAHAQAIADIKKRSGHYWDNWDYCVIPSSYRYWAQLGLIAIFTHALAYCADVKNSRWASHVRWTYTPTDLRTPLGKRWQAYDIQARFSELCQLAYRLPVIGMTNAQANAHIDRTQARRLAFLGKLWEIRDKK